MLLINLSNILAYILPSGNESTHEEYHTVNAPAIDGFGSDAKSSYGQDVVYTNQPATPEHTNIHDDQLRVSDIADVTRNSGYEVPQSEYEKLQTATKRTTTADPGVYEHLNVD